MFLDVLKSISAYIASLLDLLVQKIELKMIIRGKSSFHSFHLHFITTMLLIYFFISLFTYLFSYFCSYFCAVQLPKRNPLVISRASVVLYSLHKISSVLSKPVLFYGEATGCYMLLWNMLSFPTVPSEI